jgi:hypothetical protein
MTSMKLTKILILTLVLMTIAATVSFADVNFISSAGRRVIQVNAQTGMTSTILLSATGPSGNAFVGANESIFLTYNADISALQDIQVRVQNDVTPVGGFTAYNTFVALTGTSGTLAEARVGIQQGDRRTIQIHFTAPVTFLDTDSIEVGGVRVNAASAFSITADQVVKVDFTNAIGQAVVTNGQGLEVAVTREPMSVTSPTVPINFLANGTATNDIATVTLNELFTNAFETRTVAGEAKTRILLTVSDLPQGIAFSGVYNVIGLNGLVAEDCTAAIGGVGANQALICVDSQSESLFESIQVGLRFALVDTAEFAPAPATVTATLTPVGPTNYPYPLPLRYAVHNASGTIPFGITGVTQGLLLSTFNAVITNLDDETIMNTGIAIMNGSGAAGLPLAIGQAGEVTVAMYPMDGSGPYTFTTSANDRPGLGLDANGRIPPKGTWAVLVSQFLPLAENKDGDTLGDQFEGFIVFTCKFPNAEGIAYISDAFFSTYAQGYQMINLALRAAEASAQMTISQIYDLLTTPVVP